MSKCGFGEEGLAPGAGHSFQENAGEGSVAPEESTNTIMRYLPPCLDTDKNQEEGARTSPPHHRAVHIEEEQSQQPRRQGYSAWERVNGESFLLSHLPVQPLRARIKVGREIRQKMQHNIWITSRLYIYIYI